MVAFQSPQLEKADLLHCCFLNGCNTGELGHRIVQRLPWLKVICWTSVAEDAAARSFALGFYDAVGAFLSTGEETQIESSIEIAFWAGLERFAADGFRLGDPSLYLHPPAHPHAYRPDFSCHGCCPPVHGEVQLYRAPLAWSSAGLDPSVDAVVERLVLDTADIGESGFCWEAIGADGKPVRDPRGQKSPMGSRGTELSEVESLSGFERSYDPCKVSTVSTSSAGASVASEAAPEGSAAGPRQSHASCSSSGESTANSSLPSSLPSSLRASAVGSQLAPGRAPGLRNSMAPPTLQSIPSERLVDERATDASERDRDVCPPAPPASVVVSIGHAAPVAGAGAPREGQRCATCDTGMARVASTDSGIAKVELSGDAVEVVDEEQPGSPCIK